MIRHTGKGEPPGGAVSAVGLVADKQFAAGLIFVFAVSLAVYANTLVNGFVYDDAWQVVGNSWIRSVRFIPDILSSDVWSFSTNTPSNYYRPVMFLVYLGVYSLAGLDPRAFHLANLLLNALVCVAVYVATEKLLRRFGTPNDRSVFPAVAAAVLFAVHPVHTEAVAWIAGVPELTYTLFCLLTLYCHVRADDGERWARPLSVAAFLVALFCKEPALLFPLVLFAYDHCLGKASDERLARFRRYVPYFLAAAVYLAARAVVLGGLVRAGKGKGIGFLESLANIFPLFSAYLAKLAWPAELNAYTVFEAVASLASPRGAVSVVVGLAFVTTLFVSFRRRNPLFLCLTLLAVPLLPVLYIPALPENIFAERYLYFPSVGLVLLVAFVLARMSPDKGRVRALVIALGTVAALSCSVVTVQRNAVWKDNVSFYSDVLKKSPQVPMMHVNLGWTYFKMGLYGAALREYEAALRIKPDLAEAHNNIGLLYERQNLVDAAVGKYETALAIDPDYAVARNNLGNAYLRQKRPELAIREFQEALRILPRYAEAHYNLGNVYFGAGLMSDAAREYELALEIDPYEPDARNNLGIAYLNLNRLDDALDQFRMVLRIAPDNAAARQSLERALSTR